MHIYDISLRLPYVKGTNTNVTVVRATVAWLKVWFHLSLKKLPASSEMVRAYIHISVLKKTKLASAKLFALQHLQQPLESKRVHEYIPA